MILGAYLCACGTPWAWKLSVFEPYNLRIKDAVAAVIIGEALSSMIPLGILVSGTSKAVAVRKQVPLSSGCLRWPLRIFFTASSPAFF